MSDTQKETITRVKICGLTRPDQAQAAAALGAYAAGMIFAPSPRRISPETGYAITRVLPPTCIATGVFVNASVDEVNSVAEAAHLGWIQLHGEEPPEMVEQLCRPCIKAFRVRDENWGHEVNNWLDALPDDARDNLDAVLLDAYSATGYGGTGVRFNWQWVVQARDNGLMDTWPPLILAGGLHAGNVLAAVAEVHPWMLDVSSGVELSPGIKDMEKVRDLFQSLRGKASL